MAQKTPEEVAAEAAAKADQAKREAVEAQHEADQAKADEAAAAPRRDKGVIVGDAVKADYHQVILERTNNEKIKTFAYDWEVPILERIHGTSAPRIVETYEVDVPADAQAEWDRLKRKYNRKDAGQSQIVEDTLRDVADLAKQMGVSFTRGNERAPTRSANTGSKRKPKAKAK